MITDHVEPNQRYADQRHCSRDANLDLEAGAHTTSLEDLSCSNRSDEGSQTEGHVEAAIYVRRADPFSRLFGDHCKEDHDRLREKGWHQQAGTSTV